MEVCISPPFSFLLIRFERWRAKKKKKSRFADENTIGFLKHRSSHTRQDIMENILQSVSIDF